MKHTKSSKKTQESALHEVLHYATVSFLVAGIVMLTSVSTNVIQAQSTGNGSTVVIAKTMTVETIHPSAPVPVPLSAATELSIGSILIFLGFCFHALLVLRSERPVRVRAVSKKAPKFRIQEWYWMEILPVRKGK